MRVVLQAIADERRVFDLKLGHTTVEVALFLGWVQVLKAFY